MLHYPIVKLTAGSLLPGLSATLLLLLLCIGCLSTGYAQTHLVFAHFHMPYAPHGASVAGYMRDIQDAKAVGIDGFALNMGAWDGRSNYVINTGLMFQAAKAMGPGFKLFFSPDMSGGLTAAQIQDMVRSYAKHPNYFYYQGRLVLSSWAGEGGGLQSRDFWLKEVFAPLKAEGINPFFVPMFYTADYDEHPDYAKVYENFHGPITQSRLPTPYAAWWKEVVDGMYSFGCVGLPSYQQPSFLESEEAFARVVHDNKRLFMSAVTPQYWGAMQLDNKRRYYEYDGGKVLLRNGNRLSRNSIRNGLSSSPGLILPKPVISHPPVKPHSIIFHHASGMAMTFFIVIKALPHCYNITFNGTRRDDNRQSLTISSFTFTEPSRKILSPPMIARDRLARVMVMWRMCSISLPC